MPYVAEMSGSRCIPHGVSVACSSVACIVIMKIFTVAFAARQRWDIPLFGFHAEFCSIFARNRPWGDVGRPFGRLGSLG